MSKIDTNHMPIVPKSARLRAAAHHSELSSLESAAKLLFIGRRTLQEIESGIVEPRPETIKQMSELYHAPELLPYFCAKHCPVGKARGFHETQGMRPEGSALHILSLMAKTESYNRDLIEAAKDGAVQDHDKETIHRIIAWIDELNRFKDELIVATERRDDSGRNETIHHHEHQ